MRKAIGFWYSSSRRVIHTAHGRKFTTNSELADTCAFTRKEAVAIARKKFGKGKYTIGFTKSVKSPSPELIQTLGYRVLGR